MIIIANLLIGVAQVLSVIFQLYTYILIGRCITSWVNADPDNFIVRLLYAATEPVLAKIRPYMPKNVGIDLSIIAVFLGIMLVKAVVLQSMIEIAMKMK